LERLASWEGDRTPQGSQPSIGTIFHKVIPGDHRSTLIDPNVTGMTDVLSAILGQYTERLALATGTGARPDA